MTDELKDVIEGAYGKDDWTSLPGVAEAIEEVVDRLDRGDGEERFDGTAVGQRRRVQAEREYGAEGARQGTSSRSRHTSRPMDSHPTGRAEG